MTVQCGIYNMQNIIFASDSAVTTPDGKKYTGIQKIFKISDIHPAKMMINGYMEFEKIPLKTLISDFTKKTDMRKLKTVKEISNAFISFLHENTETSTIDEYIKETLKYFKQDLNCEIRKHGFEKTLKSKQKKPIPQFLRKYKNFDDEFKELIPPEKRKKRYTKILWEIFSMEFNYLGTGVVIAGNNIDSYYPSFIELNIHYNDSEGVFYDIVESKFDFEESIIRVYAINNEGYTFLTGSNENYSEFIKCSVEYIRQIMLENLIMELKKEKIEKYKEEPH